jgi:HAE1 family hydrophobic/amphiphilic exporter-1
MLIGIVKKNAIMMIDFALEAQRAGTARARPSTRVSAPLPPDHDDDHGGAHGHTADRGGIGAGADARRPLGLAVVAGSAVPAPDALHHAGHLSYLEGVREHLGQWRRMRRRVQPVGTAS